MAPIDHIQFVRFVTSLHDTQYTQITGSRLTVMPRIEFWIKIGKETVQFYWFCNLEEKKLISFQEYDHILRIESLIQEYDHILRIESLIQGY